MQDGKDARLAFHATSVGFYEHPCAARKTWISCQRRTYGFMSRLALIVISHRKPERPSCESMLRRNSSALPTLRGS